MSGAQAALLLPPECLDATSAHLLWPNLICFFLWKSELLQEDALTAKGQVWVWGACISAAKEEHWIFLLQTLSECWNCCCCFMRVCCFSSCAGKGSGAWNPIRKRYLSTAGLCSPQRFLKRFPAGLCGSGSLCLSLLGCMGRLDSETWS